MTLLAAELYEAFLNSPYGKLACGELAQDYGRSKVRVYAGEDFVCAIKRTEPKPLTGPTVLDLPPLQSRVIQKFIKKIAIARKAAASLGLHGQHRDFQKTKIYIESVQQAGALLRELTS